MARVHPEIVEDILIILGLGKSEGPKGTVSGDTATEEPSSGAKILNLRASREGGLEGDDEGSKSDDEDAIVNKK